MKTDVQNPLMLQLVEMRTRINEGKKKVVYSERSTCQETGISAVARTKL